MKFLGTRAFGKLTRWAFFLTILFAFISSGISPVLSAPLSIQSSTQSIPHVEDSSWDEPQFTTDLQYIELSSAVSPHLTNGENPYLFGVINDQGQHYDDLWQRGVRATTFEFQWKRYEPQEGLYDLAYIHHMQDLLRRLKAQGWYVQLVPGFHYTPDWVFANYPDMYFVNQYGETYNPDPLTKGDFRVTNAPFNPQARALIASYIARIFIDFDQTDPLLQFDSVRVGGGVQGELRYPPADWNGHTNSYWAFDAYAQDNGVAGIPTEVQGWRPGIDPNPGTVGRGQLIVNPGFERLHPSFHTFAWSPDDPVTAEIQSKEVYADGYALKITIDTPHRIHQFVRVNSNTNYQFGGWLQSGTSDGLARLIVTQYDSNSQPIPAADFAKLETDQHSWTSLSGSLSTGPSTTFLKVELDGDRSGTYYYDDLWLEREGETNELSRDIEVPLAFYEWYLTTLTAFQEWQIDEIRTHYQGSLDLVYAGKGLLKKQITDALTNDLQGDMWSEKGTALYAGTDYQVHLDSLGTHENIVLYMTGVEDPPAESVDDFSSYPGDWSAARWLSHLSHTHGIPIWGENSGGNSPAELNLAISRMAQNDFKGLMWAFESDLYAAQSESGFASVEDYEKIIVWYSNMLRLFIPVITLSYYFP